MSYILEALKKAQAERQLGATPTIHAPTLHSVADQPAGKGVKRPVLIALGAMGAVIVALLALVWNKSQPVPQAVQQPAPVLAPTPAVAAPAAAPVIAMVATPAKAAPVAKAAAKQPEAPAEPARAAVAPARPPAAAPAVPAAPAAAPVAAAAQDEVTQTLRELPEPIQRAIPQIAVGGYIYSKNPVDRLLLIDKVLRHEGEEVAPGLLLEKLLPKSAVFNYKGYRYRVPY